jgi:hypothetical protein
MANAVNSGDHFRPGPLLKLEIPKRRNDSPNRLEGLQTMASGYGQIPQHTAATVGYIMSEVDFI